MPFFIGNQGFEELIHNRKVYFSKFTKDMELFYRKTGQGSPLIILHGLFGSCDNWLTISKPIADLGFEVYMIDQRNHGRSAHSDGFNYDLLAADLMAFITQHQLQNPVLVGHSMGGKTVMQFVANYPSICSKLIVVDIAPKFYPIHHYDILDGLRAIPLASLASRNEADEILARYEPDLSVRQFLLKNLYRTEEGSFGWRINLEVLATNIHEVGVQITAKDVIQTPTLFIRGAESDYINDTDWPDVLQLFPNAMLQTIDGAGHWVQAQQPQAFVTALRLYLND
jgi:esterase